MTTLQAVLQSLLENYGRATTHKCHKQPVSRKKIGTQLDLIL